jgi:hypothetical protein
MKSTRQIAAVPRAGAIALLALICSCNGESRLEGHYSTANGLLDIEFKDAQKANVSTNLDGSTHEVDYERNGKEVKLKMPDETVIATIGDDGCLTLTAIPQPLCKEKKVASAGFFKRALPREQRLEGLYSSVTGLVDLEFKDGNKVNQTTLLGPTMEIDYELSGKELKLKAPTGTMVGTIADDGCLEFGGFYGAMCKKKIASGQPGERYTNDNTVVEFMEGHKVKGTNKKTQATGEWDYEVNGKEVTLKSSRGTVKVTIVDDRCISFNDGSQNVCLEAARKGHQMPGSFAEQSYVDAMKAELRIFSFHEEGHAADNSGTYFSGTATPSAPLQGFRPSDYITIIATSVAGPPPSWSATAKHAQTTKVCNMTNGVVTCT